MIFLQILTMAALVFFSRYLFLEPKLPLRLNSKLQKLLNYSSPAVLTAIWAPIVFTPHQALWLSSDNPYLWAATLAVVIAWKTKNVLMTTVVSMSVFLLLNLIVLNH
jgi:branched-subunit amino acid transport protein